MNVLKVLLVDVRVRVRLSGVAVFMLVLNVLVIVQDVRVGVRYFPMRVLVRVLLHRFPVLGVFVPNVEFPAVICELMGASSTDATRHSVVTGKFFRRAN